MSTVYQSIHNAETIDNGIVLLKTEENSNVGLRLLTAQLANHGDIGDGAIDLSYSPLVGDYGAVGDYSLASGVGTIALNSASHVFGTFNVGTATDTIHEIGIGADAATKKNAFEIYTNGRVTAPELTLALISTPRSLVTKEYADSLTTGISTSELEKVTDTNTGWRILGVDTTFKKDIGVNAIDLSFSYDDWDGTQGKIFGAGDWSFTAGYDVVAGDFAAAFGAGNKATGEGSFVAGEYSIASGVRSTAFGEYSIASGACSFANGDDAHASGANSTSFGFTSRAYGDNSFATGLHSQANGPQAFASGINTVAIGANAYAEGSETTAATTYGKDIVSVVADSTNSIITVPSFGSDFTVGGYAGFKKLATNGTTLKKIINVQGNDITLEDILSTDIDQNEVIYGNKPRSSGVSHAEGSGTLSSGRASHAEGMYTKALGYGTHSEGYETIALGDYSHAEGYGSVASGYYSHAEGNSTKAINYASHAEGAYNVGTSYETIHETGIGTADANRANAFEIYLNGRVTAPALTSALINTPRSLVTKEYADALAGGAHTHTNSTILDNTTASFLVADETKVDYLTVTGAVDLDTLNTDSHTHTNSTILDNTTASFLVADETKVDKIENTSTLTDGATVAVNMGTGSQFSLSPTQDFTLSNPTGLSAGQRGYISITQDATGSRLLTLGTYYKTSGGTSITLTTTAAALDVLRYEVISTTLVLVELISDVK